MNIERLARWLEPIIPQQISTWMKARDMADAETRQMIEKQIVSTAYQIFGNPRKAMILSLPPTKITNKPLKLGNVYYDHKRQPFGLSFDQLLQHTAIFGRSGAGKTNVVMNLFRQLIARNIPILFLDWKRNGREIIPHVTKKVNIYTAGRSVNPFPFNPFITPLGVEDNVYVQHVVDVMADAYTLGDGARSLLQKSLVSAAKRLGQAPDIHQLIEALEQISESSKQDKSRNRSWKTTAMRALEELKLAKLTDSDTANQQKFAQQLTSSTSIIELDSLSVPARKFIIPLLFSWVYQVKLSDTKREKLSLVLILEEAHNVLHRNRRSTESLTEQLLRQCREIGIGVVLVDQQPNQIASTVLGNVHTSICMNLKDPADITRAAGLSLLDDSEKLYLNRLEIGAGIVKLQSHWQYPFIVRFDLLKLAKGKVTDEMLIRLYRGGLAQSSLGRDIVSDIARVPRGHLADTGFTGHEDDVFSLITDILKHPDDGVKIRYRRLNLSIGKGNRLKHDLLALGWVTQRIVPVDNTRKVTLAITNEGRKALGLDLDKSIPDPILSILNGTEKERNKGWIDVGLVIDYIADKKSDQRDHVRRESLEHAYWKNRYALRLAELGYTVKVESPSGKGFADIAAQKAGQTIIFEIETGCSDFVKNLRHGLNLADCVVIAATSEKAMRKIERMLAAKGLLIEGRVELVLKDNSRYFGKE